jgi:D-alanine-D-alanine ligase
MNTSPFQHVAVLMGGDSSERDISLHSGQAVAEGLAIAGFDVTPVVMTDRTLELPAGIEGAFIALHGTFGEDGGVQSLLDAMEMPYTGAGAVASRRAFDKVATKQALDAAGIPTAAYAVVGRKDAAGACPLPFPVVVKPPCQGSSVGISMVTTDHEWGRAVELAARFGDQVLVEAYVAGREWTVGIVGDQTLPVVEIEANDGWYDYSAKYAGGTTHYHFPAGADEPLCEQCLELSRRTFDVLEVRGLGRVDFRVTSAGEPFVLELNSIPGFTSTSLLPKAAAAAGMTFSELCRRVMLQATFDKPLDGPATA